MVPDKNLHLSLSLTTVIFWFCFTTFKI